MDLILGICAGVCLAAAAGFRVFVPLLLVSVGARAGWIDIASGFDWIGSGPALLIFAVATLAEVLAYFIPWVDNLLDTVAGPAAVIAGVLATAAVVSDVSPALRWVLAILVGGGVAGTVQGTTSTIRGASTVTTGGTANPAVASAELAGATTSSLFAMFLPVIGALAVVAVIAFFLRRFRRRRQRGATA